MISQVSPRRITVKVEVTRMGIRYTELLAFVSAYKDQRFATIEARLAALEAV